MSELAEPLYADRALFSLHEEEDVVEIRPHRRQVVYFETNLQSLFPDRYVAANMGVYWVPGQYISPWVGPDLFVAARPPREPVERVWAVWEDGPLQFVAEVASEKTRRSERQKREEIYQEALAVPECLYVDLDRHQLELWRLETGAYRRVRAAGGRLYSEQLGLWFGWDPDRKLARLWRPDGKMMPTADEIHQQLLEAEERATALAAELERLRREPGDR
jgi:Uma2 family endonuclease